MPDNKPKHLNLLGLVLMVLGFITALTSLVALFSGGRQFERAKIVLDQQLSIITPSMKLTSSQESQIEQIRQDMDRRFSELDRILESPGLRVGYGIQGLLGLSSVFAGFGFLKKRPWVIKLVMAQSAATVIFYAWWLLASPLVAYQDALSALMFNLLARVSPLTSQAQMDSNMRMTRLLTQWGGLLSVAVWNGFLIWVVRKPSVKDACGAK